MSQALSLFRAAPMSGRPDQRPAVTASGARPGTLLLAALLLTVLAASGCAKADDGVATQPTTSGPTTNAGDGPRDTALASDVRGSTTGTALPDGTSAPTPSPSSPSSSPTTSHTSSTSGTPAGTARSATTSTAPTATTAATVGGAPASSKAFCSRNERATDDFEHLDPTKDFETYLAMLRRVTAELVELAPPAIKADVQVVADAFAAIKTAEQLDDMTHDPLLKAASDRVTAWTEKHCPRP